MAPPSPLSSKATTSVPHLSDASTTPPKSKEKALKPTTPQPQTNFSWAPISSPSTAKSTSAFTFPLLVKSTSIPSQQPLSLQQLRSRNNAGFGNLEQKDLKVFKDDPFDLMDIELEEHEDRFHFGNWDSSAQEESERESDLEGVGWRDGEGEAYDEVDYGWGRKEERDGEGVWGYLEHEADEEIGIEEGDVVDDDWEVKFGFRRGKGD